MKKKSKATIINTLQWGLAIFFALMGAVGIREHGVATLILSLAAAVLVCPLFREHVKLPKKIWIPGVVVLFLAACICLPTNDADKKEPSSTPTSASTSVDSSDVEEPPAAAVDEEDTASNEPEETAASNGLEEAKSDFDPALGKDIADYNVTFWDSVHNDVTGNWRLAQVSETDLADIENYALSYYMRYFEDDSEVHFIVNFALNTTTRINCTAGQLFVTVFDYVEDEEHDAKKLPSGEELASYVVTIEDGTVEDLSVGDKIGTEDAETNRNETGTSATGQGDTSSVNSDNGTSADNPSAQASAAIVYVSNSGKIHSSSNCSGMKHYTEMTYDEAIAAGYVRCQKCY